MVFQHDIPITKPGVFNCETCYEGFGTSELLEKHMKLHHVNIKAAVQRTSVNTPKVVNEISRKRPRPSSSPDEMANEPIQKCRKIENSKNYEKLQCEICDKLCSGTRSLSQHQRSEHYGEFIYIIIFDHLHIIIFLSPILIIFSINFHIFPVKRQFQCTKCDYSVNAEHHLQDHMRRHQKVSIKCTNTDCTMVFVSASTRNVHLKHAHGSETTKIVKAAPEISKINPEAKKPKEIPTPSHVTNDDIKNTSDDDEKFKNSPFGCGKCRIAFFNETNLWQHLLTIHKFAQQ
jgi:hypothetical protein